uniref:Uncharacterized protein n=1 Tax=Thermogemmatispora argillosa TaxID=2045280 RepID=A0A455T6L5_9CHLR|nr:hypothetical protein KTA_27340 [Thermogemmatispora argillosa]
MDVERGPHAEQEPPTRRAEEAAPGERTLSERAAQASTAAGHAPGHSGLWSGADPILRNTLIVLTAAWYLVLLLPVSQALDVLVTPLANFLMDHLHFGDIFSIMVAYAFWACLIQSGLAIICYFACGWPPTEKSAPGLPSPPHGLRAALRATACYLLADAILFFPFFILYLFSYGGFRIETLLLAGILLYSVTLLLAGGLLFNGLLALTFGLGAYWLANSLGRSLRKTTARKT